MKPGEDVARRRARMPEGTNSILSARTVRLSHRRLAELLRPGISVLDVGCGNGAISAGIAREIQPGGSVIGVDVNPRLIEEANSVHATIEGLTFQVRDAYDLQYNDQFDITSASRVLQWLSDPMTALNEMVKATVTGGTVIVLDYSHEKLKWEPDPPHTVRKFYDAFLEWRASAGMDNLMADNMKSLFEKLGLHDIRVTSQHEIVNRGDHHFEQGALIWALVMASRGLQVVSDGVLSEPDRAAAERDYREWVKDVATSQSMYLLAVEGTK